VFVEPDWRLLARFLAGEIDAIIARTGSVWDHAPAVILAEEAGGRFRDHQGGRRLDLRGGIYSNGRIDASVEALIAGKPIP
jgi:fructose-1,6-bisphosphatase/inositol monophosphatase family enzyme